MRLIDLNTVLEEIEDTVTSVSFCGTVEAARSAHETKDRILSRIKELPTIDAVPVTHGKWHKPMNYYVECNLCGRTYEIDSPQPTAEWNYCPGCGAKMDLKEEQNGTDNP